MPHRMAVKLQIKIIHGKRLVRAEGLVHRKCSVNSSFDCYSKR